jgi:hypothetical protein
LKSVVLIGSPINGSALAPFGPLAKIDDARLGKWAALIPGTYAIAEGLRPNGAQLRMLHVWNKCARRDARAAAIKPRIIKGTDDFIVGDGGLATWYGDQEPETLPLDHRQLCKVDGDGSPLLDLIRTALE